MCHSWSETPSSVNQLSHLLSPGQCQCVVHWMVWSHHWRMLQSRSLVTPVQCSRGRRRDVSPTTSAPPSSSCWLTSRSLWILWCLAWSGPVTCAESRKLDHHQYLRYVVQQLHYHHHHHHQVKTSWKVTLGLDTLLTVRLVASPPWLTPGNTRFWLVDTINTRLSLDNMFLPRIVGGDEAPIGKFPWLVNLGYQQVASQCNGGQ